MSKHEEANLILKLYDLRREAKMREARDWYFMHFNPTSVADINNLMFSEDGAKLRMVMSYWDMAAAMVNHGAIAIEFFNETNGEHIGVFAKIEPFLAELRTQYDAPEMMANLEKLIDKTPNGREKVANHRERMKGILSELASRQKKATARA